MWTYKANPRASAAVMAAALAVMTATIAEARVKLITLPVRERVEIQLDNPNATLVEEERFVPLVKGDNQVDFSWANTQIDPNTILLRILPQPGGRDLGVKVISVSFPPNEAALVWDVSAAESGPARVRISYLLGNLNKSFSFRAVASRDEKTLTLCEYMRVHNLANERFASSGLWAGFGPHFLKPIGINETKEMLVEKYEQVPVRKTYTASLSEFGYLDEPKKKLRIPMHYVLKNAESGRLGKSPLPAGKARIFQDDGQGATAFLGEDWGKFTPLDDELPLYLGVAQDIVVTRTIEKSDSKRITGDLFDHDVVIKYEIENFKDAPATLDVAECPRTVRGEVRGDNGRDVQWQIGQQTTFAGGIDAEKSTFERVVLHASLPARGADGKAEKIVQKLHLVLKNEWK